MKNIVFAGLFIGALAACQPTAFELTSELEATCVASKSDGSTDSVTADQTISLGSVPAGSKSHCFVMTWPLGESTHIRGFRVADSLSSPTARAEVYQLLGETTLEDVFGLSEDSSEFACPGILNDDRLRWWFESNEGTWIVPEAGARTVSGGTRLLVRLVDETEIDESNVFNSEWLTTSTPTRIAQTATLYDPFWLLDGAFDLPASETKVERSFTIDLASQLGLDTIDIHQIRMEAGDSAVSSFVAIERSNGNRICLDNRRAFDTSGLTGQPFTEPVSVSTGDLLQVTCEWDTSAKTSPSVWSMTDESCRAVLVYTTEGAL